MKIIETNGITYLESLGASENWYWGTDYIMGDLYEAEEVYNAGTDFKPNRLIFVHYPDGEIFEPIRAEKNQYLGLPAYIEGVIYILLVDFDKKLIRLFQCSSDLNDIYVKAEIPLDEVKDCYNLNINGSPVMVTRQGAENLFQVIWPEKVNFAIGERESFINRVGDSLYFSEWYEDEEYREEVNIREFATGNLIEKMDGTFFSLKNNVNWILK